MGLLKRKKWPQCHGESSWQERRSRPCQNEKEQSRQSRVPDHERGESQCGREPHLGEREEDQSGSSERKGWLYSKRGQIQKRKGTASKKSPPRRSRKKHEQVSRCKSAPGQSAESWFHFKSGLTWNRKEGWEMRNLLIRWKSEMSQGDS